MTELSSPSPSCGGSWRTRCSTPGRRRGRRGGGAAASSKQRRRRRKLDRRSGGRGDATARRCASLPSQGRARRYRTRRLGTGFPSGALPESWPQSKLAGGRDAAGVRLRADGRRADGSAAASPPSRAPTPGGGRGRPSAGRRAALRRRGFRRSGRAAGVARKAFGAGAGAGGRSRGLPVDVAERLPPPPLPLSPPGGGPQPLLAPPRSAPLLGHLAAWDAALAGKSPRPSCSRRWPTAASSCAGRAVGLLTELTDANKEDLLRRAGLFRPSWSATRVQAWEALLEARPSRRPVAGGGGSAGRRVRRQRAPALRPQARDAAAAWCTGRP